VDARRGMGADFLVSTPINRTKWQSLRLDLISGPTVGASGMATGQLGCGYAIPTGQGDGNKDQFGLGAAGSGRPRPSWCPAAGTDSGCRCFPMGPAAWP
jgi:hypothetical protein